MFQVHKQVPLPDNEEERLRALHYDDILDSRPEEAFDRLTSIVKMVFDVGMSGISLVDLDRLWFKSCPGFDEHELVRDLSFCGLEPNISRCNTSPAYTWMY